MKLCDFVPNAYLYPYISRYWIWENEGCLPKVFAGTGAELMFTYGNPLVVLRADGSQKKLPESYLMMPRFGSYQLQQQEPYGFISIRFRAGAFRHFCRNSSVDFIDSFVDIEDVWGYIGAEFRDRVISAETIAAKIQIIEHYLFYFLEKNRKVDAELDLMTRFLLYDYNKINVSTLCRDSCLSQRQIERKLKDAVGVSPKTFQRISRFEALIKELLLNHQQKYLDIAMEYGYYDQSHFLKEFKKYVGEYPSAFLQEKNFMSNFYNKKLHI